jgi:ribosomal protein S18 acetylase RimI-like enzyme
MLATQEAYRGRGIATKLVSMAIEAMQARDADEVGRNRLPHLHALRRLM